MDYSTDDDLGVKVKTPVAFCCDSKAAIYIADNLVFYERTKHTERDYHFFAMQLRLVSSRLFLSIQMIKSWTF